MPNSDCAGKCKECTVCPHKFTDTQCDHLYTEAYSMLTCTRDAQCAHTCTHAHSVWKKNNANRLKIPEDKSEVLDQLRV